jgi:hypothetical protein
MAEKINIASLQIDFDQVIKKSGEFKKRIEELKVVQKSLDKTTEEGSKAFAANEVQLRQLGKAYRDNQQFAVSLENANKDLDKTLSSAGKSTQELRDSRRDLNQISKQLAKGEGELTGNIEEELALRDRLNVAIDEQTEALRNQSSEFNKSKDGIGEYKKNIKEALEEFKASKNALNEEVVALTELREEQEKGSEQWNFYNNQLNQTNTQINILITDFGGLNDEMNSSNTISNLMSGNFKQIALDSEKAGGGSKFFGSAVKGAAKQLLGLVKASLAFLVTPFGLVLLAIAGAFLLIKNAMNRSEEATNKIRKAFSGFSGIVKALLKFLEPLGNFLIDVLVESFELVEKGIFKAMEGIAAGLELLGFEGAAASLKSFTNEIQLNAAASRELVKAEIELEKAQRLARKTQLDFQKQAEKLRQIRDDDTKSIPERIKANEELGDVLKEQLKQELLIAEQAVEVARLRVLAEGETKGVLDAQAEALTQVADIQERITGQESEQLVNRVSLQREARDQAKAAAEEAKKIADQGIKQQEEELELFIQQQGLKAKGLKEQLEIQREISKQEIEILKANLENRNITQLEFDSELLRIKNELLQQQAELTLDYSRRELDEYILNNQSKIDNEMFFSEQLLEEERSRLERISEQKKEFEAKRLEEGVISQQAYNDAINAINDENRINLAELEAERKEAEAEKDLIDLENKLLINEEGFQNDFAIRQSRLKSQKNAEIENAEKTGADKDLINQKYAGLENSLSAEVTEFKADQNIQILSGLKGLFSEGTVLNKAFAVGEIVASTVKNATQAFAQAAVFASNPITAPLAVNANIQGGIIVASGATQAAKIAGIKLEKGGILKGARHSQGGIDIGNGYEAEDGEAVINRRSTRLFAPLLSRINQAGGGRKFAEGGILGGSSMPSVGFDVDILANKIADANRSLPVPVVGVEEFAGVASGLASIEENAEF